MAAIPFNNSADLLRRTIGYGISNLPPSIAIARINWDDYGLAGEDITVEIDLNRGASPLDAISSVSIGNSITGDVVLTFPDTGFTIWTGTASGQILPVFTNSLRCLVNARSLAAGSQSLIMFSNIPMPVWFAK